MGAISNAEFDLHFIDRTKKIIAGYNGDYNITLLLNCLMGLIILPSEFYRRHQRAFFRTEISEVPELAELIHGIYFEPTRRHGNIWIQDNKSLSNLIKKIRNGISHSQIECIDDNGKWDSVIIRDFNIGNGSNLELQVQWTPAQLKEFALFVATSYETQINRLNARVLVKKNSTANIGLA